MVEELKEQIGALLMSPNYEQRNAIHRGWKTITIREGWRDYHAGWILALYCQIIPWAVSAKITAVRHTRIMDLTYQDLHDDGYNNHQHAVKDLRQYYPNITLSSRVTVIRWDSVSGYWVDHPDEYQDFHDKIRLLLGDRP